MLPALLAFDATASAAAVPTGGVTLATAVVALVCVRILTSGFCGVAMVGDGCGVALPTHVATLLTHGLAICTRFTFLARPHGTHSMEQCSRSFVM